jgi:hypothetical protein
MRRSTGLGTAWILAAMACLGAGCSDTVQALTQAVSPPADDPPPAPGQIGGRWGTRWGTDVCNLVLHQDGASITGEYTSTGAAPGTITGTFASNVLAGTWTDRDGNRGGIALTFAPDARSFQGTWGSGDSATNGGTWTGNR